MTIEDSFKEKLRPHLSKLPEFLGEHPELLSLTLIVTDSGVDIEPRYVSECFDTISLMGGEVRIPHLEFILSQINEHFEGSVNSDLEENLRNSSMLRCLYGYFVLDNIDSIDKTKLRSVNSKIGTLCRNILKVINFRVEPSDTILCETLESLLEGLATLYQLEGENTEATIGNITKVDRVGKPTASTIIFFLKQIRGCTHPTHILENHLMLCEAEHLSESTLTLHIAERSIVIYSEREVYLALSLYNPENINFSSQVRNIWFRLLISVLYMGGYSTANQMVFVEKTFEGVVKKLGEDDTSFYTTLKKVAVILKGTFGETIGNIEEVFLDLSQDKISPQNTEGIGDNSHVILQHVWRVAQGVQNHFHVPPSNKLRNNFLNLGLESIRDIGTNDWQSFLVYNGLITGITSESEVFSGMSVDEKNACVSFLIHLGTEISSSFETCCGPLEFFSLNDRSIVEGFLDDHIKKTNDEHETSLADDILGVLFTQLLDSVYR